MRLQAKPREVERLRASTDQCAGPATCALVHGLVGAKTRATLLVDQNARLFSANAAASALIEAPSIWSISSNQLIIHCDSQVTANLHSRIRKLATDRTTSIRSAFFVNSPDDDRTLVTLTRVETDPAGDACEQCGHMVLVSIIDGQPRRRDTALDLLTDVLRLTHAEAQLALSLMYGLSLQNYSDQAGVRITTVRWHLRNALAKTGCANQRDFVRLIITVTEE